MEILGLENLPDQGGLIIASNHKSYWDPVVVGCALPKDKQVFFMAKEELFRVPLLNTAITWAGAFPVKRSGTDGRAVKTALKYLYSGKIVGIFPEGTRNTENELLEPHLGMAMLAARANVPVLPVAVVGARGLFGKVTVKIGKIINTSNPAQEDRPLKKSRQELFELSNLIMDNIAMLIESDKR